VIPFLVLAIGVDNLYLLTETYDATDPSYHVEARMEITLDRVGASIGVAALSETIAFLFGMGLGEREGRREREGSGEEK
jgi:Niemann-Pick C1 protein